MSLLAVLAVAGVVSGASGPNTGCDGNTREMELCIRDHLAQHEAALAAYVSAARERIRRASAEASPGPDSVAKALGGFDEAELAWSKYRQAECAAVYDYWSQGTIRGLKSLKCRIILTQRHAHTIWSEWLQYEDDTPPILPEPPQATFP